MVSDDINENREEAQRLPVLSPEGKALVAQTIDEVIDADLEEALLVVERHIQTLDRQAVGTAFETLQIVLQSLWNYFEGIRLVRTKSNFVEARDLFQSAADGFNQVGEGELRDLSIGVGVYTAAVTELQRLNMGQALELHTKVKEYLRNAGKYGSKFESLIDQMDPEFLFMSGIKALMTLDFTTAKSLIEKASQAAEQVAHDYYKEREPLYYTFQGMARFYKAYYTFYQSYNAFNHFEYDKLADEQELIRDASRAQELLGKGSTKTEALKNMIYINNAIVLLLKSISELARLMQRVFDSTFKPDLQTLRSLKQKIRKASNSASKVGEQAVTLVRLCDQLSNQVNNIERLAKPSKKDFGKFSGLVASALFLPLFLIVSWANLAFEIGLKASTLIISCLILALIGGFGFGALKFKSFIFTSLGVES